MLEDPFFVPNEASSKKQGMFIPKFDVHENPEAFVLEGEVPGISDKNALDIHFTDQQTLVVHGRIESFRKSGPESDNAGESTPNAASKKPTVEEDKESGEHGKAVTHSTSQEGGTVQKGNSGPRVWIQERSVGEFQRSFNFPAGIDQDNVKASLNHGILTITVPKMQQKGKRRVTVE